MSRITDFDAAAKACMPLIRSALESVREGVFPKGCFLNVDIPRQPEDAKVIHYSTLYGMRDGETESHNGSLVRNMPLHCLAMESVLIWTEPW